MNSQSDFSLVASSGQSSSVSSADAVYAQGVQVPPTGNTGASSTSGISLDYLTLTLPARVVGGCEDWGALLEVVGLDSLGLIVEERKRGHRGWRASASLCQGGVLAWGGQAGTAQLELSGGALGYLSALGLDVFGWLCYVLDLGARVTRFDVALDDYQGLVTRERVIMAFESGGLVTHARSFREVRQLGEDARGWTFYIGSRTSPTFVRVYDKGAEQGLDESVHWYRVEAEFKRERAAVSMAEWRDSGFAAQFALGLLRGAVDFRAPTREDSNASRWALLGWWRDLVEGAAAVRVRVAAVGRTMADVSRWLVKSVSGALAAFDACYGADAVQGLIERGRAAMSWGHRSLVMLELGYVGISLQGVS